MGLLATLARRGAGILSMVALTLILISVVAGASGLEERILVGKLNYQRRGYSVSLSAQVQTGELNQSEVAGLLEEFHREGVERYGLDKPWWGRLIPTMIMVMTFDLGGTGALMGGLVWEYISEAIPSTVLLLVASMGISAPLGILIGASKARNAQSRGDLFTGLISTISYAIPGWLLGYVLLAVLIRVWYSRNVFYAGFTGQGLINVGSVHPVFDFLFYWFLPIASLVIPALGFWTYQSRAILVNVAQEEFVTVAEAKGLSQSQVNRRYILRVGLPPILTQVGLVLHSTIANSVPVEVIFGWHGLGHLLWTVVWMGGMETYGSAGLLLGVVYAYALVYAVIRFALEVLYVVLDPRIRY